MGASVRLIEVVAIQDESGHWYLIPNEFVDEFRKLDAVPEHAPDYEDACDKINDKFGEFRTGGDLNNTQLYIKY